MLHSHLLLYVAQRMVIYDPNDRIISQTYFLKAFELF